jgi:PRD1 phage membrane DNA delivery
VDGVQGLGDKISQVISAIIGLAVLAVVLSQGAQTVAVLNAFFTGFAALLKTVMAPVSAGTATGNIATGLTSVATGSTLPTASTVSNAATGLGGLFSGIATLFGGSSKPAAATGTGTDPFDIGGALKSGSDDLSGWLDTTGL